MKLSLSPPHSLFTLLVNIPQGISRLLLDFVHVQQNLADTIVLYDFPAPTFTIEKKT